MAQGLEFDLKQVVLVNGTFGPQEIQQLIDAIRGDSACFGTLREAVADKGYHSNAVLEDLAGCDIRTYISEPNRGRRKWKDKASARDAVYANRRRIRGARGEALRKKRGEYVERPFAHCYDTGGMRRTHLRGHPNILKRLLIHVAGFNLGLVLRRLFGVGTPRGLQGLRVLASALILAWWTALQRTILSRRPRLAICGHGNRIEGSSLATLPTPSNHCFTTGC